MTSDLTTLAVDASWVLGGVLHVVRGTVDFKKTLSTGVWSTPENLAVTWNVANGPFQGTTAPVDASWQSGTSLFVIRGTTLFEQRGTLWVTPQNLAAQGSSFAVDNAPFKNSSDPVHAAVMVGTSTLYIFRGDTLFVRAGATWMPVTSNLSATGSWGGPNRPYSGTTVPLDTAYFIPSTSTSPSQLHFVRGTSDFMSPYTSAPTNLNTASQWAASNGPLDAALGAFSIGVSPATASVVWGQTATITVTITSNNGFNGPVALSIVNPTVGLNGTFSPANVSVPAFGSVVSTLTISSVAAATKTTSAKVTVKGVSGPDSTTKDIAVSVLRTPGAFSTILPLINTASSCGSVTASVGQLSGIPQIAFQGPGFNTGGNNFSGDYKFSGNCKAGAVMGRPTGGIFGWSIFNLGFSGGVARVAPGQIAANDSGPNSQLTDGFFSPDASLFLVINPGGGTPSAGLFDVLSGSLIGGGGQTFNTSITGISLTGKVVTATLGGGGKLTWTVP